MRGSIAAAAMNGDRLSTLTALRDRLAEQLDADELDERSIAGISKELRAVIAELEQIAPVEEDDSPVASIARRRAARVARAAAVADAGRRSQPRRSSRGG